MLEKGMQDINGSLHAVIHAINKNYQKKMFSKFLYNLKIRFFDALMM